MPGSLMPPHRVSVCSVRATLHRPTIKPHNVGHLKSFHNVKIDCSVFADTLSGVARVVFCDGYVMGGDMLGSIVMTEAVFLFHVVPFNDSYRALQKRPPRSGRVKGFHKIRVPVTQCLSFCWSTSTLADFCHAVCWLIYNVDSRTPSHAGDSTKFLSRVACHISEKNSTRLMFQQPGK